MSPLAFRGGLELCGFQACVRLGHRKAGFFLSRSDRRQHAAFLLRGAVKHHGMEPENIHVHGGSAGQPGAGGGDGVHHRGGFGDAEARAAELLRDADAEPAAVGDRAIEFLGKVSVAVALKPIIVAKARADFFDCGADGLLKLCDGEVDGGRSKADSIVSFCLCRAGAVERACRRPKIADRNGPWLSPARRRHC